MWVEDGNENKILLGLQISINFLLLCMCEAYPSAGEGLFFLVCLIFCVLPVILVV